MDVVSAYCAGAIDADGFITLSAKVGRRARKDNTKPIYFTVKVGLSQTEPIVPALLFETFGGWTGTYKPRNPKHKLVHLWSVQNLKAEEPLRALLPYLRLKREHARLCLEFVGLLQAQNQGRFMAIRLSDEQLEQRLNLYRAVAGLNQVRNRRRFRGLAAGESAALLEVRTGLPHFSASTPGPVPAPLLSA